MAIIWATAMLNSKQDWKFQSIRASQYFPNYQMNKKNCTILTKLDKIWQFGQNSTYILDNLYSDMNIKITKGKGKIENWEKVGERKNLNI